MYKEKFAGKRVLVVEDEYFLADEIRRGMENLGAVVVEPTGRVADTLELLQEQAVDVAILDIHLRSEMVFPVGDALTDRNIPFVFATGYDPSIVPTRLAHIKVREKPTDLKINAKALFENDVE